MQDSNLKKKRSKTIKYVLMGIAAYIIIMSLVSVFRNTHSQLPPHSVTEEKKTEDKLNTSLNHDQLSLIYKLESEGYISIVPELNEVYVKPQLWLSMDAITKENFSASMATYCGDKKGTRLYWVNIIDYQSGKKLAKYSKSWGFKVY